MLQLFTVILTAALLLLPHLAQAESAGEVTICHIPPGNPENPSTIHVSQNALEAHLAHGDELGECDEPEPQVTGQISCGEYRYGSWSTSVDPTQVSIVVSGSYVNGSTWTVNFGEYESPGSNYFNPPPVGVSFPSLELWLDGVILDSCALPWPW